MRPMSVIWMLIIVVVGVLLAGFIGARFLRTA